MRRVSLLEGIAFALAASLGASILVTVLAGVLPGGPLLRLVLAGAGFAYVAYLMGRSEQRIGRLVVLVVWSTAAAAAWWLAPPLPSYALIHLGLIWLVRSLYHHGSVLSAVADLGLLAIGQATALWAYLHTDSVFLAVWCFFLVQSLFVAIPPGLDRRPRSGGARCEGGERFERAHRNADNALRKLRSIHH